MTIGDRISIIIKEKDLKKVEFAATLEIDQSYVSKLVKGKAEPSLALLEKICRTFGVRREWLERGEGEMYVRRTPAILEQLTKEYQLDERSRTLVENFLSLTPENRKMVIDAFDNAVRLMTRKPDDELTREEMHARLDEEIDEVEAARKRGTETSSASIGTSGSFLRSIKGKT